MDRERYQFEIAFYESLDRRNSNDARVMELLAQLYTRVGRIEEGLSMDLRLSKARPSDPMVHYNLACSLALVGQPDDALDMLKQSIQLGYSDFEWMLKDEDLARVRKLPKFGKLLREIGVSESDTK
ncbi:MAG: hypothetical protein ABQ298_15620 [Puniceicoccaceae bacterium]